MSQDQKLSHKTSYFMFLRLYSIYKYKFINTEAPESCERLSSRARPARDNDQQLAKLVLCSSKK